MSLTKPGPVLALHLSDPGGLPAIVAHYRGKTDMILVSSTRNSSRESPADWFPDMDPELRAMWGTALAVLVKHQPIAAHDRTV